MKVLLLLLGLLLSFQLALAQGEKIEQSWVREDSVFITNYIKALQKNPPSIEAFLQPDKKYKEDLGFGYSSIEGSMGKGYVSVFYQLIYHDGKLISFMLSPQMPSNHRLIERYKKFYFPLYKSDGNNGVLPYYYNYDGLTTPLNGFPIQKLKKKEILSFLMTPFSGVTYGQGGGEAFNPLNNRIAFNEVKDQLDAADLLLLLYSKNPATRLMAAELYYKSPFRFLGEQVEIQSRIQEIFKVHPKAKTISGCLIDYQKSEELVMQFVKE